MLPPDTARSWSATQGIVSPSAVNVEAKDIGTCQRTRSCAPAGIVAAISAPIATDKVMPVLGLVIRLSLFSDYRSNTQGRAESQRGRSGRDGLFHPRAVR